MIWYIIFDMIYLHHHNIWYRSVRAVVRSSPESAQGSNPRLAAPFSGEFFFTLYCHFTTISPTPFSGEFLTIFSHQLQVHLSNFVWTRYNIRPNGKADTLTLHGACPVLFGTKWGEHHLCCCCCCWWWWWWTSSLLCWWIKSSKWLWTLNIEHWAIASSLLV